MTEPLHNTFRPAIASEQIRCRWASSRLGQCTEESDFVISFQPPPCGCQDEQVSHRYCIRHMIRAFHSMMGLVVCPSCGRIYRGILRLNSVQRL